MRRILIAALIAGAVPFAARAESAVAISSAVYVEHGAAGATRTVQKATYLSRGQRVILMMNWQAPSNGGGFTVTTPVPPRLAFERSANGLEDVSVDGGRSWGRLGALRIEDRYGVRLASAEDVTHLRWRMSGGRRSGQLTWAALVR